MAELAPVEVRRAATAAATTASADVRIHKAARRALLCHGGYSQKRDKRAEYESGAIGAGVLDRSTLPPPAVLVLARVVLLLLSLLLQVLRENLEKREQKRREREEISIRVSTKD